MSVACMQAPDVSHLRKSQANLPPGKFPPWTASQIVFCPGILQVPWMHWEETQFIRSTSCNGLPAPFRNGLRGFYVLKISRASLVVQRLRICLPMQGTRVQALVREDPTCRRATMPVCHNYWAWGLESVSHNYWARVPQLLKPVCLEPVLRNKRSHPNEKPAHPNEEGPPLAATRENPRAATKTQHSPK